MMISLGFNELLFGRQILLAISITLVHSFDTGVEPRSHNDESSWNRNTYLYSVGNNWPKSFELNTANWLVYYVEKDGFHKHISYFLVPIAESNKIAQRIKPYSLFIYSSAHFMPLVSFYSCWKQKTSSFLMLLGATERDHWHKILKHTQLTFICPE